MAACRIDHLTITAPTLATGAAYVEAVLGVAPQAGGEHPRMGTHNRLLHLGEQCFLEVIAVNPAAQPPDHPRWFALDQLAADTPPRLAAWVARSGDIGAAAANCGAALGVVEPMSRGQFDWRITIPQDGSLPLGGAAPILIQWRDGQHPANGLVDHGLSLQALEIQHPQPAAVGKILAALGLADAVKLTACAEHEAPSLLARIATPSGTRTLATPFLGR